jgi:tRNA(Ile)-lysidine synthase
MPHRSHLYQRWSQEMKRKDFFRPGDRVGVAVSGGPDSVLLLHFIRQFAREATLKLATVHFNHKLRADESEADEQFVREQAESLGMEFMGGAPSAGRELDSKRRNLEAAGREARYRFFFSLINRGHLDKIVTGHSASDQAETVLLRLLRGSGTRGLGAIYPSLGGKIFRPFLSLTRSDILRELQVRRLEFREDSTNRNVRFLRNRIRHELLPWLEEKFNPEVAALLAELSERARDDEEVLEQLAHERSLPWRVRESSQERIPVRPLVEFHPSIQRRILRQMIQAVKGDVLNISHRQLEALRQLARDAQSGRRLVMRGHVEARKEFDWLIIGRETNSGEPDQYIHPLRVPGEVQIPQLGLLLRFKIIETASLGKTYNEMWMRGLDPQKLPGELSVRNWRPGDRFRPVGSRKIHKLKGLLARSRVPAGTRKFWPVLQSGGDIAWVRGFPPAVSMAGTPTSKKIILIEESIEPAH